jgi:hypothetical protein
MRFFGTAEAKSRTNADESHPFWKGSETGDERRIDTKKTPGWFFLENLPVISVPPFISAGFQT